jgi:hypothetical protein
MATQVSISKAQVQEIVKRTRAGESRAAIRDAM